MAGSARYWVGVCYPENMMQGWEDAIGDLVQVPYAYCIHNLDHDSKSDHRKDHAHIILAFPNTTTYKHALDVFQRLSAEGKKCINKCEAVISIRNQYDYLIHDTDACRRAGKELYPRECRITGNNFDIGAFEQVSISEKKAKLRELKRICRDKQFTNFADFDDFIEDNFPDEVIYFDVLTSYSGYLERYIKGIYLRKREKAEKVDTASQLSQILDSCKERNSTELNEYRRMFSEFHDFDE